MECVMKEKFLNWNVKMIFEFTNNGANQWVN